MYFVSCCITNENESLNTKNTLNVDKATQIIIVFNVGESGAFVDRGIWEQLTYRLVVVLRLDSIGSPMCIMTRCLPPRIFIKKS
jgi:hypothetical protein